MENKDFIILGILGLVGMFLFMMMRQPSAQAAPMSYNNAETWDISWNQDGLPEKVVVHRNAVTASAAEPREPLRLTQSYQ